jgi:hypothetical protein
MIHLKVVSRAQETGTTVVANMAPTYPVFLFTAILLVAGGSGQASLALLGTRATCYDTGQQVSGY